MTDESCSIWHSVGCTPHDVRPLNAFWDGRAASTHGDLPESGRHSTWRSTRTRRRRSRTPKVSSHRQMSRRRSVFRDSNNFCFLFLECMKGFRVRTPFLQVSGTTWKKYSIIFFHRPSSMSLSSRTSPWGVQGETRIFMALRMIATRRCALAQSREYIPLQNSHDAAPDFCAADVVCRKGGLYISRRRQWALGHHRRSISMKQKYGAVGGDT